MQVPIPTGSYQLTDVRASVRRLLNCYSENAPSDNLITDSQQKYPPVILRRSAGIRPFASTGTTPPVRGLWMLQGIEYAVIGNSLYTVSGAGVLAQVATGIQGNGIVRMSDNGQCLVIVIPYSAIGYTYGPTFGFAPITDPMFLNLGAIDIGFIDSYIVFLQLNGRGFYNDDGQINSGVGPITFHNGNQFPREYGTDAFQGMAIADRGVVMFGERTSEQYVDAGNQGATTASPFVNSPSGYMEIGAVPGSALAVAKQDNSIFWLASDRTIRRLNQQTPVKVSNSGIDAILENINTAGCYALAFSNAGHLMVAFTFPAPSASRTLVYDCNTAEWHEMGSFNYGYWRPLCIHNAFGVFLVGDTQGGNIGVLDSTVRTEFGIVRTSTWIHQAVYDGNNRISHKRLDLVLGQGFAALVANPANQEITNPQITLKISDDGGVTFRTMPLKSIGTTGDYTGRATWTNVGTSRRRVYRFDLSADVTTWVTDLIAELRGGRF